VLSASISVAPRPAWAAISLSCLLGLLTACSGVSVAPTPDFPKAIIQKTAVKVGVVVTQEMRDYKHTESRGGVGWDIALGAGHLKLARDLFGAAFEQATIFAKLDEAKLAKDIAVIFEPIIEQYSFATARDTGSDYYAATILYRINIYNSAGERVDSFTLTGYGNSRAGGMSGTAPLDLATRGAMRDAAAKFMVQFPEQEVATLIAKGQPLLADKGAGAAVNVFELIEAVPIRAVN
jgi:hypothetical protein